VGTATNVKGKLAYVWDLSGEEHTSHDARDRVSWVVKRVRDPLHGQLVSYRTAFEYDAMDRLTSLIYPDNDAIGYRYNDRSLLQTITGGPTGSIVSNLVYFPSDQQREILYGNGIRTAYAYDERLRLKTLNTAPRSNPGSPFIAFDYDFDGVSNIRSITDQRPGTVVPSGDKRRNTQLFQYDDLYRLTRVQ
jgi:YD repeat-containing protein